MLNKSIAGDYKIGDLRQTNCSFISRANDFIKNVRSGNTGGITSHLTSTYQLMNIVHRDEGSYLHIHITARDDADQPRHGGGDLWTATLSAVSGNLSTAGRIVDHVNGTYSVFFLVAWGGISNVNIILIHPSAAVEYLRNHVWIHVRVYYDGHFKRGKDESKTNCTVVSTSEVWDGDKCVFSHPLALGNHVFICEMPDDGIPCNSLIYYGQSETSFKLQNQVEQQLMKGHEHLFKK